MRKFTFIFLFISVISASSALAQITITESDVADFYSTSNTFVSSTAESATVDIGSPGGGNAWDFSMLNADSIATLTNVDPSGTPFASEFSDANYCQYFKTTYGDTTYEFYSYKKIGSGKMERYGNGTVVSSSNQSANLITNYSPPVVSIQFPVTNGLMWSSTDSMMMSTDMMGNMMVYSRNKIEMRNEVDGYGTVKMPDGSTSDALRIRQVHVLYSSAFPGLPTTKIPTVDFLFITKSGQFVSVTSSDTTVTSGSVTGDVNWSILKNSSTGVFADKAQGSSLTLEQNQPNPFRTETQINYQVARAGKINLSVYDLSGRKIRTLVNSYKPVGAYQVVWNGQNEFGIEVNAGYYFSRLQSDNLTRTVKMLVTK